MCSEPLLQTPTKVGFDRPSPEWGRKSERVFSAVATNPEPKTLNLRDVDPQRRHIMRDLVTARMAPVKNHARKSEIILTNRPQKLLLEVHEKKNLEAKQATQTTRDGLWAVQAWLLERILFP